jgi:amino-acid N-acetyltransferase
MPSLTSDVGEGGSVQVRRARLADVPAIERLVARFAGRGEILPRSTEELYQTVREWMLAERDGHILGCGGLVVLWADMAEIRSLVVDPEHQGGGIGRELVAGLLLQAMELEIPQVIALTRKPAFFHKQGFRVVPRESLPRKIWKDCVRCRKFVGCDEVAMLKPVPPGMPGSSAPFGFHARDMNGNGNRHRITSLVAEPGARAESYP